MHHYMLGDNMMESRLAENSMENVLNQLVMSNVSERDRKHPEMSWEKYHQRVEA